ncbi:hypothetical protein EV132_11379 [Rhizobium sullae]|uniref:Uncharacterized protein n=1 Tax=Rhizobium sullae TaxID=50338 RepID=A0A4V2V8G1_RHISU|nr:hypothetical protein EV132_11379 [Rhizobium sullae]
MTATDFINEKFASADFEASANDRLASITIHRRSNHFASSPTLQHQEL